MTDTTTTPAAPEATPDAPWPVAKRWVFLVFIAVLAAAGYRVYTWSEHGAPLSLRLEMTDKAIISKPADGKVLQHMVGGWKLEKISFRPLAADMPFAIAESAYDNLRLIDIDTGAVVYENTFDDSLGEFESDSETHPGVVNSYGQLVLENNRGVTMELDEPLENVALEMEAFNNRSVMITLYHTDGRRIEWYVRHLPDYDQRLQIKDTRGKLLETAARSYLLPWQIGQLELWGRMSRWLLSGLGFLLAGLVVAFVVHGVNVALSWVYRRILPPADERDVQASLLRKVDGGVRSFVGFLPKGWMILAPVLALGISVWLGNWLVHIGDEYVERMPHVQDSVCTLFQAKKYAAGRLWLEEPPQKEAFAMQFMLFRQGRWYSIYPFGWPILLMIGVIAGVPWAVSGILSAISILGVYFIGRHAYESPTAGLVGAGLVATSAFTIWLGGTFMGHAAATFYQVMAVLFLVLAIKRFGFLSGMASGLFVGLIFNTRPMNGMAMVFALTSYFVWSWWVSSERPRLTRGFIGYAVGGLTMFALFLGFNWACTGDPLVMPYSQYHAQFTQIRPEFGPIKYVQVFRQITQFTTLYNGVLAVAYFNWPIEMIWTVFSFMMLAFVTLRFNRWDVLMLAVIAWTFFFYAPYPNKVLIYGPRYYYEIMPQVMLLTARGVMLTGELCREILRWLRLRPGYAPAAAVQLGLFGFIGFNVEANLDQFLNSRNFDGHRIYSFMPRRLSELKGFNYIKPHIQEQVKNANLPHNNVMIFLSPKGGDPWYKYGSIFHENDPLLREGRIIYVRDKGEASRNALMEAFPGRLYFTAHYNGTGRLEPITPPNQTLSVSAQEPLAALGKEAPEEPEEPEELAGFRAIAVTSKHLAVADMNYSQLLVMEERGAPVATLTELASGSAKVSLPRPSAVTFASDGNLVVVDRKQGLIAKSSLSGALLWSLAVSDAAKLQSAVDVAPGPGGALLVSDPVGRQIVRLSPNGSVEGTFTGDADFAPLWIDTDTDGTAYVADNGNERIQVFNPLGESLGSWELRQWPENPESVRFLQVDRANSVLLAFDPARQQVNRYTLDGKFLQGAFVGEKGVSMSGFAAQSIGKDTRVYLVERETGKLHLKLMPEPVNVFKGGIGEGPGQFEFARAIATDNDGNIFVVDREQNRVQKFNAQGDYLLEWGRTGDEFARLGRPFGIDVDDKGRVFIANGLDSYVSWYSPIGDFISMTRTNEVYRMYSPFDVDFNEDNKLFITNAGHRCIHVLRPDTENTYVYEYTFGEEGEGDGQFSGDPISTYIDRENKRVLVTDRKSPRIQLFDYDGNFLETWPVPHKDYNDVVGYRSDSGERYYLVTRYNSSILVLDSDGQPVGEPIRPVQGVAQLGAICRDRATGDILVVNKPMGRVVRLTRSFLEEEINAAL